MYRNTAIGAFDYITVLLVVCKDCKSVASNTGKIIDRDQKKRKMLEYFLEVPGETGRFFDEMPSMMQHCWPSWR